MVDSHREKYLQANELGLYCQSKRCLVLLRIPMCKIKRNDARVLSVTQLIVRVQVCPKRASLKRQWRAQMRLPSIVAFLRSPFRTRPDFATMSVSDRLLLPKGYMGPRGENTVNTKAITDLGVHLFYEYVPSALLM